MQVAASVDRGRFVRTLGVIILATFFFGLAVSNLVFGLSPFGNGFLGFSFNADDLITGVDTGTSAAAAGLRPGDHINAAAMPFGERIHVLTTTPLRRGPQLRCLS